MADTLGDMNLLIGGDLSPLEDALNSIPAVAQTAAQNIDAELGSIADESSGATQNLASLSDALNNLWSGEAVSSARGLEDAIAGVGEAAAAGESPLTEYDLRLKDIAMDFEQQRAALEEASANLDIVSAAYDQGAASAGQLAEAEKQLADAQRAITPAIDETESSMDAWKEKIQEVLEKLGLWLTTFEVLKESITAFATEQAFEVSMTALTGSADIARETLEKLKDTALEIPVALDSLLAAAQKMTALGVSLEQIPDLLHAAADAAAATGNSFDAVASGLERVMVTGQVMARSLVQMGITWDMVAKQMGVSIEEAQAAFKKGAQSAQEDVNILVATMNTAFGGLAEKLSGTVGGAFLILKNQLLELAGSIGQALAPIAGILMDAIQPVIPVLQAVVVMFQFVEAAVGATVEQLSTLSETSKVLIGAITAVALAMEALGVGAISINPVVAALAILISLLPNLVTRQEEAAQAAKDAKEATELYGKSVSSATAYLGEWGIKLDQEATSLASFQDRTRQTAFAIMDIGDAFTNSKGMVVFHQNVLDLIKDMPDVIQQLGLLAAAAAAVDQKAPDAAAKLAEFGRQAQAVAAHALAAKSATSDLADMQTKLEAAVNVSSARLAEADKMLAEGTISQGNYNLAKQAFVTALDALEGKLAKHTTSLKAANEAVKEGEQNTLAFNKAVDALGKIMGDANTGIAGFLSKLPTSMGDFANQVALANANLSPMDKFIQNIETEINAALHNLQAATPAQKQMIADADLYLEKLREWSAQQKDIAANTILDAASETTLGQILKDNLNYHTLIAASIAPAIAQYKALENATKDLGLEVKKLGTDTATEFTAMQEAIDKGTYSTIQIDDAWVKFADHAAKAGTLTQDVVDKMLAMGAPMQIVLDAQLKSLDAQMKIAQYTDLTGESELRVAQTITQVQLAQWALHQQTMGMADDWNTIAKAMVTAWDGVSKGIADAIVNGKNFGQAMDAVFKSLATTILETLIKRAMSDLAATIITNTGLLNTLGLTSTTTQATVAASMAASAASMAASAAAMAGSITTASATISASALAMVPAVGTAAAAVDASLLTVPVAAASMAGGLAASAGLATGSLSAFSASTAASMGAASASVQATSATMITAFGAIAAAVGAIASIFSAIELAHTNTLLGRIEESTRRMDITIEGGVMPLLQNLMMLTDMSTELYNIDSNTFNSMAILGDISVAVKGMEAAILAGGGFGGGGGTVQGMSAQIADALAQQAALIDNLTNQLNSMQRQIGPGGGSQPSVIILGAGSSGGGSFSTPNLNVTLPTGSTGVYVPPNAGGLASSAGSSTTVNVSVTAGVVAGPNGMGLLATMVGDQVVQTLRRNSGLKPF
jgi:hypothetical protein